ncbi:MAG: DUF2252 family protein [Candidatus Wallbacteria bacterium]|nr:DUF2252 family protein [Candidatus Wallbacteria bacterium]
MPKQSAGAPDVVAPLTRDAVAAVREFNRPVAKADPSEFCRKMAKMAADAHAFYRGSVHLFCRDVADLQAPWAHDPFHDASAHVFLDGDTHMFNFGTCRTHAGDVILDINDFDEVLPGPFLWDVRRLAASLALAAKVSKQGRKAGLEAAGALAVTYAKTLEKIVAGTEPDSIRIDTSTTKGPVAALLREASRSDRAGLLTKLTDRGNAWGRFLESEDLRRVATAAFVEPIARFSESLAPAPANPDFFRVLDVARKLGKGIGSMGRERFYVLIEGPRPGWSDNVILELKNSAPSALAPYVDGASSFPNPVARVLEGIRRLQPAPPPFVGEVAMKGKHYLARELAPWALKMEIERVQGDHDWKELADALGRVLARDHARSQVGAAGRIHRLVHGHLKEFRAAVSGFADLYRAQTQADHKAFVKALEKDPSLGLGR